MELHAFLAGVVNFLDPGGRLGLAATVDAVHLFGAEAQRHTERVHRRISRTDHRDPLAGHQRRVEFRKVARPHQIAASEELVGRQHTVQRLAGNPHEARVARAGADEDRVESHLGDHLLDREQPADQGIALEFHAELLQLVDLDVDHRVRQAEIGNPVLEHAARLVERLVDDDFAPGLRHVRGAGHAGGTRADDADPEPRGLDVRHVHPALADRHVADEALEPPDGDGFERVADRAHAFALTLLRTHAAADGGKQVRVGDDVVGAVVVLFRDLLDEGGNVDAHRAAAHARLVGALQAPVGLAQRHLHGVPDGDLLEVARAHQRILLRHRRALLRNRPDRLLFRHGVLANSLAWKTALGARRPDQNRSSDVGRGAAHPAAFVPLLQRFLLGGAEPCEAGHEVVEVHLVGIEVGAVDARELDAVVRA